MPVIESTTPASGSSVLHIVLNDFPPDYRVLKEALALQRVGYFVTIFALGGGSLPEKQDADGVVIARMPLLSRRLPGGKAILWLKLMECVARMLWRGVRLSPRVVHAHDVSGLIVGAAISKVTGCRLVYDAHEYWADSNHAASNPKWMTALLRKTEQVLSPHADATITVSDGIADLMRERLGIARPIVVRNIPEESVASVDDSLRERLGLDANAFIFVYVGGILRNRGVEDVISAFGRVPNPRAHLVFVGCSGLPPWIDASGEFVGRLHFVPRVHPREVVSLLSDADVGLVPIRATCTSYKHCLPNKLFEYLHAGIAVLSSDLPEIRALNTEFSFGALFRDGNVGELAARMNWLVENPAEVDRMKTRARLAGAELGWENEAANLSKLYEDLTSPQQLSRSS